MVFYAIIPFGLEAGASMSAICKIMIINDRLKLLREERDKATLKALKKEEDQIKKL